MIANTPVKPYLPQADRHAQAVGDRQMAPEVSNASTITAHLTQQRTEARDVDLLGEAIAGPNSAGTCKHRVHQGARHVLPPANSSKRA